MPHGHTCTHINSIHEPLIKHRHISKTKYLAFWSIYMKCKRPTGIIVNPLEQDMSLTFSRRATDSPVYTTTSIILKDGHACASTLMHVTTVFNNSIIRTKLYY